jgi:hypothetical protein
VSVKLVQPACAALCVALSAALPASQASAADANGKLKRGGMCSYSIAKSSAQRDAERDNWSYVRALFICDHLGPVTVAQIYEKGWRVVSAVRNQPNSVQGDIVYAPAFLIIEEQ